MKTGFAHWNNRIAPVFDTARHIVIIDTGSVQNHTETLELIPDNQPLLKIRQLRDKGVQILVCGAISRPVRQMISAYGIRVIPFITGDLQDVIQAWRCGTLEIGSFSMPGCCQKRHRRTGDRNSYQEDSTMKTGKRGMQTGRGRGNAGQNAVNRNDIERRSGRGRMGGPLAAGPSGFCVCPKCGHKEQHQRGVPCVERQCSQCGAAMMRQ